uniref:Uncharacterized protein n=1 Tax=Romanomermis culicivorax TaxID=13658 RepID=A0A915JQI1_ROMCU
SHKPVDKWPLHTLPNGLASATVCTTDHRDQLTSATPPINDTTPRAKMHQKTTGPSTTQPNLYLDD